MTMHVIPSIDLLDGRVVRLKKGDYAAVTHYDEDPLGLARAWRELTPMMHIVDLQGARSGQVDQGGLVARIAEAFGEGVEVGGGIRTLAAITSYLAMGVTRVVLGTAALKNPELVAEAATLYPHRIVVAVDAREGRVATAGWLEQSDQLAVDVVKTMAHLPLAAVLYTDIERDGMQTGPNIEQTAVLADQGGIPVIASGGVGTLRHLQDLAQRSKTSAIVGAIIGRALHEKQFSLREAVDAVKEASDNRS